MIKPGGVWKSCCSISVENINKMVLIPVKEHHSYRETIFPVRMETNIHKAKVFSLDVLLFGMPTFRVGLPPSNNLIGMVHPRQCLAASNFSQLQVDKQHQPSHAFKYTI